MPTRDGIPAPRRPSDDDDSVPVILARIETKLDAVIGHAADHETRLRVLEKDSSGSDHEKRLRDLERRVWAIPTLASALAVASLFVAAYAAFH